MSGKTGAVMAALKGRKSVGGTKKGVHLLAIVKKLTAKRKESKTEEKKEGE